MPKLSLLARLTFVIICVPVFLYGTPGSLTNGTMTDTLRPTRLAALYDPGNPSLRDIWVDPISGSDMNDGATPATALRTLAAAWNSIPMNYTLTQGVRINLQPGNYPESSIPVYLESRHGTFAAPIWIRGNGAARSHVVLQGDLNIFDTYYLYIENLSIVVNGDAFHCELCDHILIRNVVFNGRGAAQETLKANQSQYLYIENSDLSGAFDNVIDFVAVQHGHIVKNKIHDGADWCAYVKGGSAYLRVEGNTIYNCGTGGFTAGQGTGFEFMVSPWLHYEAYDVKFVNNIVHDTDGACFGVNGGYNILMAYNTCYRVGSRSHVIEVVFGGRTCDGNTARCEANRSVGGWGISAIGSDEPIPNRNVYIYNNIVYNPAGYQSAWQHFAIYGPRAPSAGSNIPSPARTDTNLQIRGNLIWNGPANHPLGIEGSSQGCPPANTTCNETQLRAENLINVIQPELANPDGGDFHPVEGGNVFTAATYAIPDFAWSDAPTLPSVPAGTLSNLVDVDYADTPRSSTNPPGAYFSEAEFMLETRSFRSTAAYDGFVLESGETTGAGGLANASGLFLYAGDHLLRRQYVSFLHFDTSSLPDTAVVTGLTLQVKQYRIAGVNPFTVLGNLQVDIANPFFGTAVTLAPADFQAPAGAANVGAFNPTPLSGGWYEAALNPSAFPLINLTGATQFRLAFSLDDNNDSRMNAVLFYSGNHPTASYRPVLIVEYYVP